MKGVFDVKIHKMRLATGLRLDQLGSLSHFHRPLSGLRGGKWRRKRGSGRKGKGRGREV